MAQLSNEIKNLLDKVKLGFVATVSPDNTPNLSPRGTIVVWDNETLIFAAIKSPQTMLNLKTNPTVEINVVDPLSRKGYRFKGSTTILEQGEEYSEILAFYQKLGIKSEIHGIVKVKVYFVNEITSPLYDLGISEEEIRDKWKNHYLS